MLAYADKQPRHASIGVLEFARSRPCMDTIHQSLHLLRNEQGVGLSSTLAQLVVAAILGGIVGMERELRHKPAGE